MSKKDEIITGLVRVRQEIVDGVSSLPSARHDEAFLGRWSVKDLIAHLIGWDYTNLEAVKEILRGKLPRFYAFYDRDWASYNAKLVREHKRDSLSGLLASLESSHRALISFLGSVPPEGFQKDHGVRSPQGRAVTIVDLLQTEIDDEREHLEQIRDRLST